MENLTEIQSDQLKKMSTAQIMKNTINYLTELPVFYQ